jgi:hypothetical protein
MFSNMRLQKYAEILSNLIPESAVHKIPHLTPEMIEEYEKNYGEIEGIEYFLESIIEKAKIHFSKDFKLINNEELQQIITSLWRDYPEITASVGRQILEAYYRDGSVLLSLGLYPSPLDRAVIVFEIGDLDSLLSGVIAKGRIYRSI